MERITTKRSEPSRSYVHTMAAYDAIYFDLDSTLCEPIQDPDTLLAGTFDDAGIEPFCTPADLRAAIPDLPTAETAREFYESLFSTVATQAEPHVQDRLGSDGPAELAAAYLEREDPTAVEFRPGAKTALEFAREQGPVGLITNGGRETQTQKLRALDIEDAFDVRVFTDPAAGIFPKPDTAPFEYALRELEATPETAIHIGDSLHADVGGANAIGLDSAWIELENQVQHGDPTVHQPTYELGTLESFEAIL
ncbi:haloacid dehalogenase [Natrialba magadii ATCC 43099]|uniref:Haloacid dehalogenase n=2 Tax=Natrialba magadii (strain ATCC 43099 / DSM 3394 / CCM 3739 / CIP 104546 / IAM 13178 / JCM 8861 / NBRC 102185 / NCIMB 2190 / MS3) TaxID=547559 RepID=L9V3A2_NATMM|nr:haloacid dehalogenase [Natrialba magadii ATCC 43099]